MSSIVLPRLIAVVAMASNRVIGRDGKLPWHLPEDLKFFKETTLGHPILMGRKTFESIGKPLPKRRNIVLSRTMAPLPGVEVIRTIEELADMIAPDQSVFVIGGAEVFKMLLPACDGMYLTWVEHPYEGDALMPEFEAEFEQPEVIRDGDGVQFRYYKRKS